LLHFSGDDENLEREREGGREREREREREESSFFSSSLSDLSGKSGRVDGFF